MIREHYRLAETIYGPNACGRQMRKFGIKYAQLHPAAVLEVRETPFIRRAPVRRVAARCSNGFYAEDRPGNYAPVRARRYPVAEDAECVDAA